MKESFIEYLIDKMPLKEKIGQLLYIDYRKPNEKTINMINVFIKLSLLFDTKKEKEKLKIIFSNINIIFSILSSS